MGWWVGLGVSVQSLLPQNDFFFPHKLHIYDFRGQECGQTKTTSMEYTATDT